MMLTTLLIALLLDMSLRSTHAQTPPDATPEIPAAANADQAQEASPQVKPATRSALETSPEAEPKMIPPEPLQPLTIPYPQDAPKHSSAITISALLTIDIKGEVTEVTLNGPSRYPQLEAAVLRGARLFKFTPAQWGGEPVAVKVPYEQTFEPPAPLAVAPEGVPLTAIIRGALREKGTRAPIVGAAVVVTRGDDSFSGYSDAQGRFELKIPDGSLEVRVVSSDHEPFLQREVIDAGDELTVGYLVRRLRYDDDTVVVLGKRRRTEVSRITLKGREIQKIPGTFGDPFRVVQTLPGVTTPVSILPVPVVRGSSPSSTGFLLDKVRVPLLFHLLGGPSVIHPAFIEEIHFYPGGFPPQYGGYTGGIIDGETRSARRDERLLDLDLNLVQTGVMVRTPIPGTDLRFSGAGRFGYPGYLISLATEDFSLEYWDYQARVDSGTPRNGWTISTFGARDEVLSREMPDEPLKTALRYEFHRVDLKHRFGRGALSARSQIALGRDDTALGPNNSIGLWHISPRTDLEYRWSEAWLGMFGLDGAHRISEVINTSDPMDSGGAGGGLGGGSGGSGGSGGGSGSSGGGAGQGAEEESAGITLSNPGDISTVGAYLATQWTPTPDWLIYPGLRFGWRHDQTATRLNIDPRLTLRYRLSEGERSKGDDASADKARPVGELWLKGGVGRYHQPPRFLIPIPGLDQLALEYGLLSSTQSTLGAELSLDEGFSIDVQTYYNDMDPVIFDLSINAADINAVPTTAPGQAPDTDAVREEIESRLFSPQRGRSYGLEVLLRRRSQSGVYGWLSYTLSRSERLREGEWVLFDFDRPHILNAVLGVPLSQQWDIGVRFQYQSGAPATTTYGFNEGRKSPYIRLDLRIDKRAVWRDWMLDYYLDIQNVLLSPEEVAPGRFFRYVLPTIGLRGKL